MESVIETKVSEWVAAGKVFTNQEVRDAVAGDLPEDQLYWIPTLVDELFKLRRPPFRDAYACHPIGKAMLYFPLSKAMKAVRDRAEKIRGKG